MTGLANLRLFWPIYDFYLSSKRIMSFTSRMGRKAFEGRNRKKKGEKKRKNTTEGSGKERKGEEGKNPGKESFQIVFFLDGVTFFFFFFLKTFDWLWANPAFVCFAADNEVTQLVHIFLTSQVHRLTRFTRKVKKELDSSFSHATHIIIWIWDKAYCMAAWHLWTLVLVLILLLARIGIHSIDCAEYGQRNTNDEVLFDTSLYASVSVAHEHKFAPVLDYGTILWSTWRKLARKKLLDSKLSHGAVPQHADTGCQSVVSKITDNRTAFEPGFLIKPKSWNMSGKKNWKQTMLQNQLWTSSRHSFAQFLVGFVFRLLVLKNKRLDSH